MKSASVGVFGDGGGWFIVGRRDLAEWRRLVAPTDGGGVVMVPPDELPVELTGARSGSPPPAAPSGMRAFPQPARATPSPTTATASATPRIPTKTPETALSFPRTGTAGRETRSRPAAYSDCRSDQRQETRTRIEVPSSLRTRILTPHARQLDAVVRQLGVEVLLGVVEQRLGRPHHGCSSACRSTWSVNESALVRLNGASYIWIARPPRLTVEPVQRLRVSVDVEVQPLTRVLADVVVGLRRVPVGDQQTLLVREVLDPVRLRVRYPKLYGPVLRYLSYDT